MTGQRDIPALLRAARQHRRLTQKEAAKRAGVSHRLWAEVEQGRRPNVSFATMLRMLAEAGIEVHTTDPAAAATARAAHRRATWGGAQIQLSADDPPAIPSRRADRLRAVARVSADALALVRARPRGR